MSRTLILTFLKVNFKMLLNQVYFREEKINFAELSVSQCF